MTKSDEETIAQLRPKTMALATAVVTVQQHSYWGSSLCLCHIFPPSSFACRYLQGRSRLTCAANTVSHGAHLASPVIIRRPCGVRSPLVSSTRRQRMFPTCLTCYLTGSLVSYAPKSHSLQSLLACARFLLRQLQVGCAPMLTSLSFRPSDFRCSVCYGSE